MDNIDGCYVSSNTNTAQNAFWEGVLGKQVNIYIQNQGEDTFKVLQVDQYFIIVEHETDGFMLINKSAIVTVVPPDTATPDLIKSLAEGIRKIKYKPSDKRINKNKRKLGGFKKPMDKSSNFTEERAYSSPVPVNNNVQVLIKPKKKYISHEKRD